jgi:hypothetical protein
MSWTLITRKGSLNFCPHICSFSINFCLLLTWWDARVCIQNLTKIKVCYLKATYSIPKYVSGNILRREKISDHTDTNCYSKFSVMLEIFQKKKLYSIKSRNCMFSPNNIICAFCCSYCLFCSWVLSESLSHFKFTWIWFYIARNLWCLPREGISTWMIESSFKFGVT